MGLWLYFSDHAEYDRYYNCTSYDVDSIPIDARKHQGLGLLMVLMATSFSAMYLPCLMIFRRHLQKPAYKIMLFIGVADVVMLMTVSTPYGIMSITGVVFCSSPTLVYVSASVSMGLWVCASEASVTLALNRCLEMSNPALAEWLFKGYRTFVWLSLTVVHACYAIFFTTPICYTSLLTTMVINPHVGYVDDVEEHYQNEHHHIHNTFVFFGLVGLYAAFVTIMLRRRRTASRSMSSSQWKSCIQVLMICSCTSIASGMYLVIPFVRNLPPVALYVGTYTWICSH
ncbi:SRT-29 protein, partial [Aphelenchoides avenae]